MLPFQYTYIYLENGINGKTKLLFVCCKCKTETANFRLFSVKGKLKFVFLSQKIINGNQHLLFPQMCPPMRTSYRP